MKFLSLAICLIGLGGTSLALADDTPAPRIAEVWHSGTHYDAGQFVTYDGAIYKALASASHRHPDPNFEEGWRKLYDCDEDESHPVRCQKTSGTVVSMREATAANYKAVQDHMTMDMPPAAKK